MSSDEPRNRRFATTRWSTVLAAKGDSPNAHDAFARLYQRYWYPLYIYVRRRGLSVHDAEDCLQGFFTELAQRGALWRNTIDGASPQRGRFRTFLIVSLKGFMSDQWRKAAAKKRGGGRTIVSIDVDSAEARYRREPADLRTPEAEFERQWARNLLENVLAQLRAERAEKGKLDQFDALKVFLTGEKGPAYAELALALGMTEQNVKTSVLRLRRRYAALLNREIADTLARPDEVEGELQHLLAVFSSENP